MKHPLQVLEFVLKKAFNLDYYSLINTGNDHYKLVMVSPFFDRARSKSNINTAIAIATQGLDTGNIIFMPIGTSEFYEMIEKATFNGF
jgi:hypothetical protein